ncbi:MAG: metallophosphoesterase [Promethearchaeia archaeon]
MKFDKRNLRIFIFLLILQIILFGWLFILIWWAKFEFIYNTLITIAIAIPIILLIIIPSYFIIRIIIKLKKNPQERISFKKSSIIAILLICIIFFSLTISALFLYAVPTAIILYNYDNGPYLVWSGDPQSSMTIIWITKNPSETTLKYGESKNDMETVRLGIYDKIHIVKLSGLKADTKYYYEIPGFSDKIYYFRTAPKEDKPFNFTAIGDNRNNGGNTKSHYGDVINAMSSYQYDFIINVGDVCCAGGDMDSWHEFFSNMQKHASTRPYMIAIGNHEYGNGDLFARNFKQFFPYPYVNPTAHYYSFTYSNTHFVMIDNFDTPLSGNGNIDIPQYNWLEQELAANQDKWLIVAFHIPPYSTGDFNMNPRLQKQLCTLFYKYKVDVVLTGHDHHYESFWVNRTEDWGGTYYFVTGGGGASLDEYIMDREENPWKHRWHNASIEAYQDDYVTKHDQLYGELTFQFMHFEIDGENMHIRAIRANGTLIQEFFIKK